MLCSRQFPVSKKFMEKREGAPRFPVEYFLYHSAEKFLKGSLLCFTKFPSSKNVRDKGGCDSRFSVEIFLCHSAEEIQRGTLLSCVSEKFR